MMDVQLKRGLLEVCVLTVLLKEDSYGYKIIKDLSENIEISESTLYPILKRLEISNYLTVYSIEHNSRLRKYYKIMPSGKQRIIDFLEEWKTVMDIYEFIKGEVTNDKI
jgi:PadR family transcriptional regulator, regulatory protein PadR